MAKDKKKKGKAGKTVAGAGTLAVIAALLGFDPFGWGMGLGTGMGTGTGTGDGETRQEQQNDAYLMQDNQEPTVIPAATVTPEATMTPVEEDANVVQLTEIAVKVSKDKVVYNDAENTAQAVADALASEYADNKDNILVKVTLEDAVYDTVEALKVALEATGIKYEIAE